MNLKGAAVRAVVGEGLVVVVGGRIVAFLPDGVTRWSIVREDGLGRWRPAEAAEQAQLEAIAETVPTYHVV